MEKLSDTQLDDLLAADAKRTPGDWQFSSSVDKRRHGVSAGSTAENIICSSGPHEHRPKQHYENDQFIALAGTFLGRVVEELQEARLVAKFPQSEIERRLMVELEEAREQTRLVQLGYDRYRELTKSNLAEQSWKKDNERLKIENEQLRVELERLQNAKRNVETYRS